MSIFSPEDEAAFFHLAGGSPWHQIGLGFQVNVTAGRSSIAERNAPSLVPPIGKPNINAWWLNIVS
jgi:hypothetical protein